MLICQKIAGSPSNEIGLIDLKISGETPKIERTFVKILKNPPFIFLFIYFRTENRKYSGF